MSKFKNGDKVTLTNKQSGEKITAEVAWPHGEKFIDVKFTGTRVANAIALDDWDIEVILPPVEDGFYASPHYLWRVEGDEVRRVHKGFSEKAKLTAVPPAAIASDLRRGEMTYVGPLTVGGIER